MAAEGGGNWSPGATGPRSHDQLAPETRLLPAPWVASAWRHCTPPDPRRLAESSHGKRIGVVERGMPPSSLLSVQGLLRGPRQFLSTAATTYTFGDGLDRRVRRRLSILDHCRERQRFRTMGSAPGSSRSRRAALGKPKCVETWPEAADGLRLWRS